MTENQNTIHKQTLSVIFQVESLNDMTETPRHSWKYYIKLMMLLSDSQQGIEAPLQKNTWKKFN